jgi:hypothetical protein
MGGGAYSYPRPQDLANTQHLQSQALWSNGSTDSMVSGHGQPRHDQRGLERQRHSFKPRNKRTRANNR